MASTTKVYEMITDKIVAMIEEGVVPWHMPWNNTQANLVSKRPYNGLNVMLLDAIQYTMEYATPWWCTYKQAAEKGGQVRRGEKSTPVIFWRWIEKTEDGEPTGETFPILRYFQVFNADQIDWPDDFELPTEIDGDFQEKESIAAEIIINTYVEREGITVIEGGNRASNNVETDTVRIPNRNQFKSEQAFYSAMFHELVHNTRHPDRLNRPSDGFGGELYSKEELVAELGAAILANMLGFDPVNMEYSAAYIASWCKVLKSDVKMIVSASSAANKAVNYILGKTYDE